MTRQNGLSLGQRLIVGLLAVALTAVLLALGTLVREGASESPLPTAVLPVSQGTIPNRTTATPPLRVAASVQVSPTASPPSGSVEVLLARRIMELGRAVGQIRELPKQQEVPLNFVDTNEMVAHLRRVSSDPERRPYIERQQVLLAALDLIPRADEAFPPSVHVRARHLIAFYDPTQSQIFVGPAGRDKQVPDISLIHQYAHALVNQHFDVSSLTERAPNGDAARARDALIEGDAMAVLALYGFGGVERADLDELASHVADVELTDYEGYLRSQAMTDLVAFPYREGARFISSLLQAGWWPAVNAAYLDPPSSTEQILHPDKYVSLPRDEPRTVWLPDLREELEGWRLITQDVMGELLLRAHLDQYLPDTQEAESATAGWGGDMAAVWRDSEEREVLVMRIYWDSIAEAIEFSESYVALIDHRLGGPSRVLRPILPLGGRWWRGEEGEAFLQRERETVLIVWAPDADIMERVLAVFVFGEE